MMLQHPAKSTLPFDALTYERQVGVYYRPVASYPGFNAPHMNGVKKQVETSDSFQPNGRLSGPCTCAHSSTSTVLASVLWPKALTSFGITTLLETKTRSVQVTKFTVC